LQFVWSERTLNLEYKNQPFLFPISYVLLIYNKLNLYSVLIYTICAQGNALDINSYEITLQFIYELIGPYAFYNNTI